MVNNKDPVDSSFQGDEIMVPLEECVFGTGRHVE